MEGVRKRDGRGEGEKEGVKVRGCQGVRVRVSEGEGEGDEERVLLNRAILTLLLRFIPLLLFCLS